MESEPSENARLATAVIESAIGNGVAEWVVCSGARNIPLLNVLLSMEESRRGKVWNFFEERLAAFFALGRSAASGNRVAVITTSGTAAAELLPATIEAHYSGVSLLMITADRPPEFRGSGAPQAIEQLDLLVPYVWRRVDWHDATDTEQVARLCDGAPEHWNVCLQEPGSVADETKALLFPSADRRQEVPGDDGIAGKPGKRRSIESTEGLVILLGTLSQQERCPTETALEKIGAPIWAEASSGLRESAVLRPLMIRGGEKSVAALEPKRVLRVGGVPSLRFWRDLETQPEIEVLSVSRTGFSGMARDSAVVDDIEISEQFEVAEWTDAGDAKRAETLDTLLQEFPESEPALFRRLSQHIASEALVYLGNSLPIREWNLAASYEIPHPHCAANRGANGIDGQVSTFLGMSGDAQNYSSGAWGIFGDLTAMYDLSAPWVLPQLASGCKRRIVVINNGGGRIFDRLPAVRDASDEQVALIRNEHAHDFQHWAAMWGMGYALWTADNDWNEPDGEAVVIEVRPDEAQTTAFWERWDVVQ